jgi:aspartyl-tRNA(Asn)/glutamyl-tRNA(Gln) amidotransferase subunit A
MTDLTKLTLAQARDGLRGGEFTAPELTEAHLAAIDGASALNAFVHKTPDLAREQAGFAQTRIRAGMSPDLCGLPLGIKDLFCTEGVPSQAASRILDGFKPPYESTVTTQLFKQGAVMLGKLNMDEFAMGSSNETSTYGNAVNPWRRGNDATALTPGGSSGGSASAVAADLCLAATGTDTGGSIRQPAAFTGITGIKPTYGRVSRWGIIAFASSLDQAGPMTKDVRDAAILLRAMSGHDPKDSTSADLPVPDFEAMLTGDIRGKVIGIPREYRMDGMPQEIEALWAEGRRMLEDAGAEIRDISLPHTKYALPCYYVIAPAEASSNLARYDGVRFGRRAKLGQGDGITDLYEKSRAEGFGPEVQRRIMVGTYVLCHGYYDAYYLQAQKIRRLIADDFQSVLGQGGQCDVILGPVAPTVAWDLGDKTDDPVAAYLADIFTLSTSLAGLPGMSIPCGFGSGEKNGKRPVGLQIIGNYFAEAKLLNIAHQYQQVTDWHTRAPAGV